MELCVNNIYVKPGRGHMRSRCLMANIYGSWLSLIRICLIGGVHRRWSHMCKTDLLHLGEAIGGGDVK